MSENGNRAFPEAKSQRAALVAVLAEDPYVEYVIGHVETMTEKEMDHPVKNWQAQMTRHLNEKYGVSLDIGRRAVKKARKDFWSES